MLKSLSAFRRDWKNWARHSTQRGPMLSGNYAVSVCVSLSSFQFLSGGGRTQQRFHAGHTGHVTSHHHRGPASPHRHSRYFHMLIWALANKRFLGTTGVRFASFRTCRGFPERAPSTGFSVEISLSTDSTRIYLTLSGSSLHWKFLVREIQSNYGISVATPHTPRSFRIIVTPSPFLACYRHYLYKFCCNGS